MHCSLNAPIGGIPDPKQNTGPAGPSTGENGPLLRGPKTSISGLEVLGGENIVNGVYARVFSTADFAPLVSKLALEVHYGQLWGCF